MILLELLKISEKQIARDTAKMTALSLAMQSAAMVFNALLTDKAGTAAVGLMSLIFSLFSFIMVLANGNILTCTSRFISEARGAGHRNYCRVMKYALTFSMCLSLTFAAGSFMLADLIGERFLHSTQLSAAVRFIALSLPFASAGSCIRGYFFGTRRVDVPMRGDIIEFSVKWASLFVGLLFFGGTELFYAVTAASILLGEAVSFFYYAAKYYSEYSYFRGQPLCDAPLQTDSFRGFLKGALPILISGYVQMLMSAANELLVPAALLKFSRSTEEALSCYGCFEALIIPAVFFPSAVLGSLSGIIMPEAALANRAADPDIRRRRLSELTDRTFSKAFSYSFFISALFLFGGAALGRVLCSEEPLVSSSLVILAPVIPFIYLEIVLEGLLKGMGRQNFSTVNSLWEYGVRIGCVMLFVGRIGFGGVLISYYASNVISNIARIIVVCRESGLRFDVMKYIVRPLLKGLACCLFGVAAVYISRAQASGELVSLILFGVTSVTAFVTLSNTAKRKAVVHNS